MTQTRFENEAEKAVVLISFLNLYTPMVRPKQGKKSKKKQKGRGGFFDPTNEREKERQKDEGREDKKEIAPQKRATKSARIKTRRLNTSR
tara:strand:- start:1580 stop:1849 length:270 start_codon:yes stop_codon:yes gene_type:complete